MVTAVNDLGFRAVLGPTATRLPRTAGGGTAIMLRQPSAARVPAGVEIFRVAEAVLRVFARLGDYQHKQRNG